MIKALLFLVLLASVGCLSVSPQRPVAEPVESYKASILANQRCYERFERIDRYETVTVINRDPEGIVQKYPRDEVIYDIVESARSTSDRSGLLSVTVHPFFSERDTFSVVGVRDSTILIRVASANPTVRHFLDDIVLELRASDHAVTRLNAGVRIHGYFRDGGHSVSPERLVSEWEEQEGCDLPVYVRHHPASGTTMQTPRLTVVPRYEFVTRPGPIRG